MRGMTEAKFIALWFLIMWLVISYGPKAYPHGSLSWAAGYQNDKGTPCCTGPTAHTPGDCIPVGEEVLSLRKGDKFTGIFPWGEQTITINTIHLSPDPNAPYVVCVPGCVFKPLLG